MLKHNNNSGLPSLHVTWPQDLENKRILADE